MKDPTCEEFRATRRRKGVCNRSGSSRVLICVATMIYLIEELGISWDINFEVIAHWTFSAPGNNLLHESVKVVDEIWRVKESPSCRLSIIARFGCEPFEDVVRENSPQVDIVTTY